MGSFQVPYLSNSLERADISRHNPLSPPLPWASLISDSCLEAKAKASRILHLEATNTHSNSPIATANKPAHRYTKYDDILRLSFLPEKRRRGASASEKNITDYLCFERVGLDSTSLHHQNSAHSLGWNSQEESFQSIRIESNQMTMTNDVRSNDMILRFFGTEDLEQPPTYPA